ncbi:MAG: glutamine synthetase [Leptospiraceae bacterium]|nr:glutamine synthetase [Leptospiraceae bacterium]MCP5501500.1 glutamine synthetase [Leptospiraceae bacterium]
MSPEEIQKIIKESKANKVKVAVTDIDGILRGKYIHLDKFLSALESGFGFCNVIFGWDCNDLTYDNVEYTGWHTGYPDALARIDPDTYRNIPWDKQTPFFLADFYTEDGEPLYVCPRQVLKKVIRKAKSMGFEPLFGLEFEFFNFRETSQSLQEKSFTDLSSLTPGMFGYSLIRSTLSQPYFSSIIDELNEFKVPVEGLHTETGPGVYEAGILYSEALEAADRAVLFKTGVKEIASRFGIIPTFMARWNQSLPGSSGHIHQSLKSLDSGVNVFYDSDKENRMSATFQNYLAGQIHCLPDLLPFFAPTVNSYKRLVEGFWAPTRVNWGIDNRTTALRVVPGSAKSTRLETRVGGADINPYLAVAAALAAGLYGIEKGLKPDKKPVQGNGYADKDSVQLSPNLYESAIKMNNSELARELFGNDFIEHFANTRIWEWRESQKAVTSYELERYFEII